MLKKEHKILNKIFKLLYKIVISFVCIISLILVYYSISSQLHSNDSTYHPKISLYTIVSQSMTPVINVYDVVVNIRPSSIEDIHLGDIITYISTSSSSEGMTITHRVVEIKKNDDGTIEFKTQGDNNSNPDSLYVSYDRIIGKEIMIIPKLGKIQFYLTNKRSLLYVLLIPIIFFIIKDFLSLVDLLVLKKKVIEVTEEEPNQIDHEKEEKLKQQIINELPKLKSDKIIKPTLLTEKVEILDTDELTSKIKEYDEKIEELNRTIKEYSKQEQKDIEEEITFLKESRIKVINTISTKNPKRLNKNLVKVEEQKPTKKKKLNLNTKKVNKVTRNKPNKKDKPKLNLNTNKINKVTRRKPNKKRLKLNPNDIKQINRPNKKRNIKAKQEFSKPRKRLIEVKKIK